jgi:hypothetical protein
MDLGYIFAIFSQPHLVTLAGSQCASPVMIKWGRFRSKSAQLYVENKSGFDKSS